MEVVLTNGKVISKVTDYPKGDPENAVTSEELIEKFEQMTQQLSSENKQRIIENILELERIGNVTKVMVEV